MQLKKFDQPPKNWDELIKAYESKTLFHELFWHNHITTILKGSRLYYFTIIDKNEVIGYFCGLIVTKLGLKVMGSPLKGTGTNYMGPIINSDIDQNVLIKSIIKMCKKEKIVYIELSNDILRAEIMGAHGFKTYYNVTHKVPIPEDEETLLKNMKRTGRNRLKSALKNNLQVEQLESMLIVKIYIEQLKEVYGKQGMAIPFGEERVDSLCAVNNINQRVLRLGIRFEDEIIATGLFPFDQNSIYFWGAASWIKYQYLLPNEIIHWEVMKFALKNNIKVYNMCGGNSQFKNKFGGEDVEHLTFAKSMLPFLNHIRDLYSKIHWIRLKVKNSLKIN
jgi:hypothetical protein